MPLGQSAVAPTPTPFWRTDELLKALYLAAARGLTLARLASIPIFLVLLTHVHREGLPLWRLSLLIVYVGIALSDVFDGMLARKAGAPSHAWGRVDAAADIAFTSLSLAAAAWLGYVGPWVPVGVAILGGGGRGVPLHPVPPAAPADGAP
jgi:phosphatidylglycerophosphate synthase